MLNFVVFVALLSCAFGSLIGYGSVKEKPKGSVREFIKHAPAPGVLFERAYFTEDGEGGSHFRRGLRREDGKVRGSYGLSTADGNTRIVYYEADEDGTRYWIESNEPGTSNDNTGSTVYGDLSGNKEIYDENTNFDQLFDIVTGQLSGEKVEAKGPAKKADGRYKTILVRPGYGY